MINLEETEDFYMQPLFLDNCITCTDIFYINEIEPDSFIKLKCDHYVCFKCQDSYAKSI